MASLPHTTTVDLIDDLCARASFQRPDLATAFSDDGWMAVCLDHVVISHQGLAFSPATSRSRDPPSRATPSDFIAYSERLGGLVGLRHGEHFRFADEDAEAA